MLSNNYSLFQIFTARVVKQAKDMLSQAPFCPTGEGGGQLPPPTRVKGQPPPLNNTSLLNSTSPWTTPPSSWTTPPLDNTSPAPCQGQRSTTSPLDNTSPHWTTPPPPWTTPPSPKHMGIMHRQVLCVLLKYIFV